MQLCLSQARSTQIPCNTAGLFLISSWGPTKQVIIKSFLIFSFYLGGGVLYTAHSAIIFFNLWLYFVLWSFLLLLLLFFNWAILSFQILTSCPCVFSFSVITCDTLICITWILVTGVPSYSELSQLPDFFFWDNKKRDIFLCVFESYLNLPSALTCYTP